mgnify:CR=1 FL=1
MIVRGYLHTRLAVFSSEWYIALYSLLLFSVIYNSLTFPTLLVDISGGGELLGFVFLLAGDLNDDLSATEISVIQVRLFIDGDRHQYDW